MNEPAFNREFLVKVRETARSIECEKSAKIVERYWKVAYMKRSSPQKLQELCLFREEGRGGGGGMRGSCRGCACPQQSRNTRNGGFNNTAWAVCPNPAEWEKLFRFSRLSSKLRPRWVIGSTNRWTVDPKKRDECATKSVFRSIEQTKVCRHAGQ